MKNDPPKLFCVIGANRKSTVMKLKKGIKNIFSLPNLRNVILQISAENAIVNDSYLKVIRGNVN